MFEHKSDRAGFMAPWQYGQHNPTNTFISTRSTFNKTQHTFNIKCFWKVLFVFWYVQIIMPTKCSVTVSVRSKTLVWGLNEISTRACLGFTSEFYHWTIVYITKCWVQVNYILEISHFKRSEICLSWKQQINNNNV